MADEEHMNYVARQAIDMHELSIKMHKDRAYAMQSKEPNVVEEMMHEKLKKDAKQIENDRKHFD